MIKYVEHFHFANTLIDGPIWPNHKTKSIYYKKLLMMHGIATKLKGILYLRWRSELLDFYLFLKRK